MLSLAAKPARMLRRQAASFSYVGLAVGTLFFAASLTPSLLPRHYTVQGVLSGIALAIGYGVGLFFVGVWKFLEIPQPGDKLQGLSKRVTTVVVGAIAAAFLWRATIWQDSIRQLMDMELIESAYPTRVAIIALATGVLLVAAARALRRAWRGVDRKIRRYVPRRVSQLLSGLIVVAALLLIVNNLLARLALNAAEAVFLKFDMAVEDGIEPPTRAAASGGPESLIDWDTIGRYGKEFIAAGPTQESIAQFLGREADAPLRVYVGLGSRETVDERAALAVAEAVRVGAFDRSLLVIATPTGTGWLDPGAVDTLEYLHAGDTAIVTMQYSYLPSWLTILVDPNRSRVAAQALFDAVYAHWRSLPQDARPKLYLHGLSLGSLGSESSADLFTLFEDPIQGGVWSGPPFPSTTWARAVRARAAGSPMWLPRFRDGSMLRFTGRQCTLPASGSRWGPMRFVYIQHASDPMCFFAPELLYRSPGWLAGPRGPDVSPYLRWYPIVTFLQTAFDLPMATTPPAGYGHNYAPSSYIDAWVEVTQPPRWDADSTRRLKERFAEP